ncbi:MAG: hypothetical protein CMJ95_11240 [Planctomycetes bacterium]|nr:hypothetical protein [Planctomycetota bacterium]
MGFLYFLEVIMRWALLSLLLIGFLSLCPAAESQTLYWIDGSDLVRYDATTATTTVLPTASAPLTLSVDESVGKIFYFRVPFALTSADLDGTNAAQVTTYPFGFEALAANPADQRLYWINAFNGQLLSIGYDGSNPQVVGGMFNTSGIGIDTVGEKLYLTNSQTGSITRRNFDGTGNEVIVAGGLGGPRDCCYDEVAGKIYWLTSSGATQRCDNDGSNIETIIPSALAPGVTHLVVDEIVGFIYLSTSAGFICRAELDGSNLIELYVDGTNISEIGIIPGTSSGPQFIRGDSNDDGGFDIADPIGVLSELFIYGTEPLPCKDAGDTNDDGLINIADAIFALSSLFVSGSLAPPLPFPDCGEDPTDDALDCAESSNCP